METVPDCGYGPPLPRRVRVLWKLFFAVIAVLVTFYAWQCGSAFLGDKGLADVAVRHFHQELNGAQYVQISQGGWPALSHFCH